MTAENILEFGDAIPDADYVLRPGGYLVVRNSRDEIAVVSTPQGCFLPGGGLANQESAAQAAIREAVEECGLRVKIVDELGRADELVFAVEENTYYRKRCTFFTADVIAVEQDGEADHELVWLTGEEAIVRLLHKSQAWAVTEARLRDSNHT